MKKPTMNFAIRMAAPLAVIVPLLLSPSAGCGGSSSPPGGDPEGGSNGSPTGGTGGGSGTPSTGGTGGTMSSTGMNTGGGTGGGTGTVQAAPCAAGDALASDAAAISSFEDGFGTVSAELELSGGWYTYKDNTMTGTIMPAVGVSPVPAEEIPGGGRCQGAESLFGLRVVGGGFDEWGAGTGSDLAFMSPPADAPVGTPGKRVGFDASAYKGIAFWAKKGDTPGATSSVRLNVKDVQTDPDGMMCSTEKPNGPTACHDDFGKGIALTSEWRKHTILFAEMKQQKFGKEYPAIKTDALFAIQFQFPKSTKFDFWLDDLHFVK